jgi:hypothetical protein
MLLSIKEFGGIIPKLAEDLLPENRAQIATNCKVQSGQVEPWDQDLSIQSLVNLGIIRTLYLYDSLYWLEWEADVNIVEAPVSSDTLKKLYFTGAGIPKKTDRSEATTGSGAMPIGFWPMAMPNPKRTPAGALGTGGVGEPRATGYVWTLVSAWGEESAPSPASDTVFGKNGQVVTISNMSLQWQPNTAYAVGDFVIATAESVLLEDGVSPVLLEDGTSPIKLEQDSLTDNADYVYMCVSAGDSGGTEPIWGATVDADTSDGGVTWRCFKNYLAAKRIYRINTGNEAAEYQFAGQISFEANAFTDDVVDRLLGEILKTTGYTQPPIALQGLTFMSNGICAGFVGKDLYFCEPYKLWAWPVDYMQSLASPIVGIEAVGGTLLVTTEHRPYVVTGTHPSGMNPIRLPHPHACVSKRSMAAYQMGIVYGGPDGLYLGTNNGTQLLTGDHYTWKEWQALYPTTMHGYIHDQRYFGFYSFGETEGCIVLNLRTGELVTLDVYADAVFVDPKTDELYYVRQIWDTIVLEDGSTQLLQEDGESFVRIEY